MSATKPLPKVIESLLAEREMSQRELVRITQRHGDGISGAFLSQIMRGEHPAPTIRALEAIASALQVDPSTFAEYEMAVIRRDLNPGKVGFQKALKNLRAIQSGS